MSFYISEQDPAQYPAQVTEWQIDDDVLGGPTGKAVEPINQLTQRTNWLRVAMLAAQTAIANLAASIANILLRLTSIEGLLTPGTVNIINSINNADNLTAGTVALARLPKRVRHSVTVQSGLATLPDDITYSIDISQGGVIEIELRNTASCALAFDMTNVEPGTSGEIHFSSIFGANRVIQLPAAAPRWEIAAPDTRNLTVGNKTRVLAYRVLNNGLIRATFIRDFA